MPEGPPVTPEPAATAPARSGLAAFLRREWVHVAMVLGALFGIAWTGTAGTAPGGTGTGPRVVWVWLVLGPLYCLACIAAGWPRVEGWPGRRRLIATQVLHWAAFLLAMWVLLLPGVRVMLNDDALGLALLLLLAMGTFVAGVHAWSLGICVTGALLGLAIPAIAWLDRMAVLLLVLAVLGAIGAGALWWWRRGRGVAAG
ncbi:MAG: hypothetical protein K2X74_18805 [Acetobacteraceae bacterium]|nr:hypothetical protein [Acetobacteraceae bacterium]